MFTATDTIRLINGECLQVMQTLQADSVDMILCDLPYGTTACKWDSIIPFELLWEQYYRLLRKGGAIVLTSSQPFTTSLIASNIERYCYNWVWNKKFGANFVQAKRQPLKTHEDICVFSCDGKMPRYYPQMTKRDTPIKKGKNSSESGAIPLVANDSYKGKVYNEKYPDSQLHYSCREDRGLHPTQKPINLFNYLISTYSKQGETVLDNCMGSGTTGIACKNLNRNFIGIELDENYFNIAKKRIQEIS